MASDKSDRLGKNDGLHALLEAERNLDELLADAEREAASVIAAAEAEAQRRLSAISADLERHARALTRSIEDGRARRIEELCRKAAKSVADWEEMSDDEIEKLASFVVGQVIGSTEQDGA